MILCEYRTIYKIGKLFFQMKNITERNELFVTTLFVFSRQEEEHIRRIIFDQIINSNCVEILAQVRERDKMFVFCIFDIF